MRRIHDEVMFAQAFRQVGRRFPFVFDNQDPHRRILTAQAPICTAKSNRIVIWPSSTC
jgi:hypothetical protein